MSQLIAEIFESRKDSPLYNTSYPLSPEDWSKFRSSEGGLAFSVDKPISFYIHIPFCVSLCRFCEYTKTVVPSPSLQDHYLSVVENDIKRFLSKYEGISLEGFDIGGGTPTALSDYSFHRLMTLFSRLIQSLSHTDDFEPSIEGTFATLTPEKAKMIHEAGIDRVSIGLQSSQSHVLAANSRRNVSTCEMKDCIQMLKEHGIHKINLDLMYGLRDQRDADLAEDIKLIGSLAPEQVTLYELRTNMTGEQVHMTKDELFHCYDFLWNELHNLGYQAPYGQNTFSLHPEDKGLSSYLRHRMFDGGSYKGFGISAQSMSVGHGISYNAGKGLTDPCQLRDVLMKNTFEDEYVYLLNNEEMLHKFIAIAAYGGRFSIKTAERIGGLAPGRFVSTFKPALDFCVSNGMLDIQGDTVSVTRKGFKYYGAIFSLFTTIPQYFDQP